MNHAADVVVVGAGPAGLCAALAAAQAGAQVALLDGYHQPGGQYFHQPPDGHGQAGTVGVHQPALLGRPATRKQRQGRALWRRVAAAGVLIYPQHLVWNLSADRRLAVAGPGGAQEWQAGAVILATGTYERLAPFPGWTLPGVITAGAAQALLYQGARPGRRVLLAGTGPLQLTTAAMLLRAGVAVTGVLEGSRRLVSGVRQVAALWGQGERLAEGAVSMLALARHGVPYRLGWGIVAAHGERQVEAATIARLDDNWRPISGSERVVACDTICSGYGFVPFSALARLAGAEMAWHADLGGEVPLRDDDLQTSLPGIYAVGDGAGLGGYRVAMLEGELAGIAAVRGINGERQGEARLPALAGKLRRERAFQALYARLFTPGPGIDELAQEDTLICRCEGVTLGQLRQAVQEMQARTPGEAKNITRCGMGECQGRVCGPVVAHTLARLLGTRPEVVGGYAPRPPVFAMPLENFLDAP